MSRQFTNEDKEYNKVCFQKVANGISGSYSDEDIQRFRNDPVIMGAALNHEPRSIKWATEDIRNNKSVAMNTLQIDGFLLNNFSDEVRDNRTVCGFAVNQNPSSMQFVSERLKNDMSFIKPAIEKNDKCYQYISEEKKADFTFVYQMVNITDEAIKNAPLSLRDNKDLIIESISKNPDNFKYASERLKNNALVVEEAYKRDPNTLDFASPFIQQACYGKDPEAVLESLAKKERIKELINHKIVYNPELQSKIIARVDLMEVIKTHMEKYTKEITINRADKTKEERLAEKLSGGLKAMNSNSKKSTRTL